ncbi:MAG: hypothetical protein JWR85_2627 [Marmoricola sp.]|jgi:aminoglycoside phosphotransferase (APT) family kinase protein|nr:hypothetical protein [Marmoricola sp.]
MTMPRAVPPGRASDLETVSGQLSAFAAAHYDPRVEVRGVAPMPGHAGLSFGFEVWLDDARLDALVLRVPPKGVRRSGNTDVLRQAPLLRALEGAGLPVPGVPWAGDDERWFGLPYLMTRLVQGETCFPWDPQPVWSRVGSQIPDLWRLGAQTLTQVHELDWREHLSGWEDVRPVADEIARWQPIYAQSPEPAWAQAAEQVRLLLLETMPEQTPIGLVHGDYQIGNILFQDGAVSAVIDWELSGIGAHLLDIGWYLTFADPESWHETWGPVNPAPVEELRSIYEQGRGRSYPDLDWYRALAGYRMGSIGCLNVKLHRRGHRVDPLWESYGLAVPPLFHQARRLLLECRSSRRSTS